MQYIQVTDAPDFTMRIERTVFHHAASLTFTDGGRTYRSERVSHASQAELLKIVQVMLQAEGLAIQKRVEWKPQSPLQIVIKFQNKNAEIHYHLPVKLHFTDFRNVSKTFAKNLKSYLKPK